MLPMESIGNRKNGEYDNLIMGKTISLGTEKMGNMIT